MFSGSSPSGGARAEEGDDHVVEPDDPAPSLKMQDANNTAREHAARQWCACTCVVEGLPSKLLCNEPRANEGVAVLAKFLVVASFTFDALPTCSGSSPLPDRVLYTLWYAAFGRATSQKKDQCGHSNVGRERLSESLSHCRLALSWVFKCFRFAATWDMLLSLSLCIRVITSLVVNCSHIFTFHLYVNSLQILSKTGLLRCCLYKFRAGLHRCLSLVYPLLVVCFRMSASPLAQWFSFLLAWLTAWHQFSCAPGWRRRSSCVHLEGTDPKQAKFCSPGSSVSLPQEGRPRCPGDGRPGSSGDRQQPVGRRRQENWEIRTIFTDPASTSHDRRARSFASSVQKLLFSMCESCGILQPHKAFKDHSLGLQVKKSAKEDVTLKCLCLWCVTDARSASGFLKKKKRSWTPLGRHSRVERLRTPQLPKSDL